MDIERKIIQTKNEKVKDTRVIIGLVMLIIWDMFCFGLLMFMLTNTVPYTVSAMGYDLAGFRGQFGFFLICSVQNLTLGIFVYYVDAIEGWKNRA
jgi:hypothetical protein